MPKQKSTKKRIIKNPRILIFSALAVILTAFTGSQFTNTRGWYDSIKPAITPPNFVFPIAWTTLFILIAIAMYLSLSASKNNKNILRLFATNLVLNILWSILFFGMQNPLLAFIDLIFLWISIIAIIIITYKTSKTASWLLLPYALWVTFAGLLNYLIVRNMF